MKGKKNKIKRKSKLLKQLKIADKPIGSSGGYLMQLKSAQCRNFAYNSVWVKYLMDRILKNNLNFRQKQ